MRFFKRLGIYLFFCALRGAAWGVTVFIRLSVLTAQMLLVLFLIGPEAGIPKPTRLADATVTDLTVAIFIAGALLALLLHALKDAEPAEFKAIIAASRSAVDKAKVGGGS